jgi:hypothetical protein
MFNKILHYKYNKKLIINNMNWLRRIFGTNTQSEIFEKEKTKESDELYVNKVTSGFEHQLVSQMSNSAASVSVFPSTQEGNARAQAHLNSAYTEDPSNGVKLYFLKSKTVQESQQFLLIKTGTTESLCKMHDEFKKGLSDRLLDGLPKIEAAAINPVNAYHNYSLPGMDLLPGDPS